MPAAEHLQQQQSLKFGGRSASTWEGVSLASQSLHTFRVEFFFLKSLLSFPIPDFPPYNVWTPHIRGTPSTEETLERCN